MADKSNLTKAMEMAANIGMATVLKAKQDFGGLKFGQRSLTRQEREERQRAFSALTMEDMMGLVQKYGDKAVSDYVARNYKYRRGGE